MDIPPQIELIDNNLILRINNEKWHAFNNSLKVGILNYILPSEVNMGWFKINKKKQKNTTLIIKSRYFTNDSLPIKFNNNDNNKQLTCSMLEFEIRTLINNLEQKMNFNLPDNLIRIKNFEPNLHKELWIRIFDGSLHTTCMLNTWFFKNIFPSHYYSFFKYMVCKNKIAEIPTIKCNINSDNTLSSLTIKHINHFDILPQELLESIILQTPLNNLHNLKFINKKFYDIVNIIIKNYGIVIYKKQLTKLVIDQYDNDYYHGIGGDGYYRDIGDDEFTEKSDKYESDIGNNNYGYDYEYDDDYHIDNYEYEYNEYISNYNNNCNDNDISNYNNNCNDNDNDIIMIDNNSTHISDPIDVSQHFTNWAHEVKIVTSRKK
jgi:hypothetical protein